MRLLAKIAAAVVVPIVLAVGLLYMRLLHGPIALSFLVEPIESAIGHELTGAGVRIESAALRLGDSGQFQIELTNLRINDTEQQPLAVAPAAAVSLSRRALLAGRIAPESIDLISPRLVVFYSEDGKLSLRFSPPADTGRPAPSSPPPLRGAVDADAGGIEDKALARIDLAKALSELSASARRREHATAYLREFGMRSATVIVDNGTRKSIWRVPELDVDLDHRRSRSSIAGRARIESLAGPWDLNFRTYEHENNKRLRLSLSVQRLVPRALARALPQLAAIEGLDLPVWGDAKFELSSTGELLSGNIALDAAPGNIYLPWLGANPVRIDGGHIQLAYNSTTRSLEIAPSVLVWGDSRVQFTGNFVHTAQGPHGTGWNFALRSAGSWLAAEPPAINALTIDDWTAQGFLAPDRGRFVLSQFLLSAGGGEISAHGDVTDLGGAARARLEGKIGPMPGEVFKALWPSALAPRTRRWVAQHLTRGMLQAGAFKLASGSGIAGTDWTPQPDSADRLSLTLEAGNVGLSLLDGWPELDVPRMLVRLEGKSLEVAAPEASLAVPDGRRMALKGSFAVDLTEAMARNGTISVRGHGPLPLALDLLDQEPLRVLQHAGFAMAVVDGKIDGHAVIVLPLGEENLQAHDIKVQGKVRVSEGKLKQALGPYDIHIADIVFDMTPAAVEARGDILVNGVPAKVGWQHVYGVIPDKQPPLLITSTLDNGDRAQLGLDVNEIVRGEVPIEIKLSQDPQGQRRAHIVADLANAEVHLESVAWRKPKGRGSTFEFDAAKGTVYPVELHNVRLVGDNVAMEGWMGIGPDNRVREFRFPNFSLNVITSLEAHGKLRADNVWEVSAKGPRYDGKDFFLSLLDATQSAEKEADAKGRPGLDLKAEIDTVVGFYDSTLRNARLSLQKRANKLVALDVRGALDNGKPLAAVLRTEPGQPRRLLVEAMDAGKLFRLVGFFPDAVGGTMNLEVNLDGRGEAQRVGTLWAKSFSLLGDNIVFNTPEQDGQPSRRTTLREKIEISTLRAPFSSGYGQFVVHDAALDGPLVSATMRGKVDFRSRFVDLGGTFTPIAGLNKLFSPVPVVGALVTGPRGEGVFAIHYALRGRMDNPQLLVNPFSAITPGITREFMQIAPENPRVVPRERERRQPQSRESGSRATSAPAQARRTKEGEVQVTPEIGGGWSAETSGQSAPKN